MADRPIIVLLAASVSLDEDLTRTGGVAGVAGGVGGKNVAKLDWELSHSVMGATSKKSRVKELYSAVVRLGRSGQ